MFLGLNFLLNLLAVRYINRSIENSFELIDVYVLLGLIQVLQFGVPISFSAEIARNRVLSSNSYRISIFIWVVTAVFLTIYLCIQTPSMLIYIPILMLVVLVNNYRGILEGLGKFYSSHSAKLISSALLFWFIIYLIRSEGIYIFSIVAFFLNFVLIYVIKGAVNFEVSHIDDQKYLPALVQSLIPLSLLYIDRIVLRSYANPDAYINFTLMQEAIYRPIGFITIFASYHFYQISSGESKIFWLGIRFYLFHILLSLLGLGILFLLDAYEIYFSALGFELNFSNFCLLATWFLLILSAYMQRIVLSVRVSRHSILILMAACVTSSIVGALTTLYFSSAVYSLLGRAVVECCILVFGMLSIKYPGTNKVR